MSPSSLTTFAFLVVLSSTCVLSIDCQNKKKTVSQGVSAICQVIRATFVTINQDWFITTCSYVPQHFIGINIFIYRLKVKGEVFRTDCTSSGIKQSVQLIEISRCGVSFTATKFRLPYDKSKFEPSFFLKEIAMVACEELQM